MSLGPAPGTSLAEVAGFLGDLSGLTIQVSSRIEGSIVRAWPHRRSVPLADVVAAVARAAHLDVEPTPTGFALVPREGGELVREAYDVADLLAPGAGFDAAVVEAAARGACVASAWETPASVAVEGTSLVVVQTRARHDLVRDALGHLRSRAGRWVQLEVASFDATVDELEAYETVPRHCHEPIGLTATPLGEVDAARLFVGRPGLDPRRRAGPATAATVLTTAIAGFATSDDAALERLLLRIRPRVEGGSVYLDLTVRGHELGHAFDAYATAHLERGRGVLLLRVGYSDRRRCALLWASQVKRG